MKIIFGIFLLFGLDLTRAYSETPRLIAVVGHVEKSMPPDIAFLNLIVWGKGENASLAQGASRKQYESLVKAIGEAKIKSSDIQTLNYELNPEYVYDQKTGSNHISQYVANQTLRIKITRIEGIGNFIDQFNKHNQFKSQKEGTTIQNIVWDLEKRVEMENELLVEAVKMAAGNALVLAKAAGVKIKGLYHLEPFNEQTSILTTTPEMASIKMMGGSKRNEDEGTPLFSGELKINSRVNAKYEIE